MSVIILPPSQSPPPSHNLHYQAFLPFLYSGHNHPSDLLCSHSTGSNPTLYEPPYVSNHVYSIYRAEHIHIERTRLTILQIDLVLLQFFRVLIG